MIGRPNAGKSSLVNAFLGSERVIVSDRAGTTRDAIDTELEVDGRPVVLVDTAGLRRRSKVAGSVDYYAQLRSERAVERADVAIVVCDAGDGITAEDLRVAELAMKAGCATLLALNKWDVTRTDIDDARARVARKLRLRPEVVTCSATRGRNVGNLLPKALALADRAAERIPTPELNRFVADVVAKNPPPSRRGRRLRLYYSAQVGERPPRIRDPGQRPQADRPRLGLPPREPHARDLRARGRAPGDRFRPALRSARRLTVPHHLGFPAMSDTKPLAEGEYLFTSESVTEGHPDKVADQISDGVLDAVMAGGEGEDARVACETLVNTNLVVISGEIRTEADLDLTEIARETIREIGYDGFDPNFGADTVEVLERMDQQSPDIAQGVDAAQETREEGSDDDVDQAGAGDQGMMFGYATVGDRGADAAADLPRPPARPAPRRGPQGRHASLPAPRRQDPGHGPLPRRRPGRDRARPDLDPARRRRRPRLDRSGPT